MLSRVANVCCNGLVGLDSSLELVIGSGVVPLDFSRLGSGDKRLFLLINGVLPSDWGIILLEWSRIV